MKIEVLGNRVLAQLIDMKAGAIHLPENYAGNKMARVIGIGEGRLNDDGTRTPITQVAVGDEIIVHPEGRAMLGPEYGRDHLWLVEVPAILAKVIREKGDKLGDQSTHPMMQPQPPKGGILQAAALPPELAKKLIQ